MSQEKAKKHKRAAVLIVIAIIVVAVSLLLFSIHFFNGNIDNDIKEKKMTDQLFHKYVKILNKVLMKQLARWKNKERK